MNRIIIILLSVTGLCSCINEGDDGCPGYFRLRFSLAEQTRSFDDQVGNDVYLYEFHSGRFYATRRIGYEDIRNGNEYTFRKDFAGETQFVAWSVPSGEDDTRVAGFESGAYSLQLNKSAAGDYESTGDIFLGSEAVRDDYSATSSVNIGMERANCNLEVNVYDSGNTLSGKVATIEVTGTKSSMTPTFEGTGDDAVIPSGLTSADTDKYASGRMGLLPSAGDQTISVVIIVDGTPTFRVDTGQASVPGKDITLNIPLGLTAELIVDGWRLKNLNIDRL